MIQARELRIGNLLHWSTNNEVVVVDSEHIRMCSVSQNDFNRLYKTIPITEEWLLKFGFDKNDDLFTFDKFTILPKGFRQGYIQGRIYLNNYKVDTYVPEYAHQLQNLFFILRKKELEKV
jgi:hypothetical protein